ncbi:MAG: GMC family oxidoreductase [Burkholderiales bacterium]
MFVDSKRVVDGEVFRADICIVGMGAAGLPIAVSLARKNRSVICIESGDFEFREDIHELNRVEMTGLAHPSSTSGRFRVFGGTTTKWGGQMLPLDRFDFEGRPWQERSGWPITYDELVPYYEQALQLTGLENVVRSDEEVWNTLGFPRPMLAPHVEVFLSRWLPEPKFNALFGDEVRNFPNLSLLSTFNAIAFDGDIGQVRTLRCASLDGRRITVEAKEFVLCMGGIETARFLQYDYADGSSTPWAANRMIGKCFADHPAIRVGRFIPNNPKRFHEIFDNIYLRGLKYEPRMRLNPSLLRSQQSANVGGMFIFKSNHTESIKEVVSFLKSVVSGRPSWAGLRATLHAWSALPVILRKAWNYKVLNRTYHPQDTAIHLAVSVEQLPSENNTITLSDRRDALQQKAAAINWRIGEAEVAAVLLFVSEFSAAVEGSKLGRLQLEPCIEQRDSEEMIRRAYDQNHHIGSTRMASDMSEGVVNPDLRVFGVDNVYVCSSSVFPTGGFSNPAHTIIALALRLADHLCEKVN